MIDTPPLQRKLERLVEHLGSQREAAAVLGVRDETFSRWMNGHHIPSGTNLMNILAKLDDVLPGETAKAGEAA